MAEKEKIIEKTLILLNKKYHDVWDIEIINTINNSTDKLEKVIRISHGRKYDNNNIRFKSKVNRFGYTLKHNNNDYPDRIITYDNRIFHEDSIMLDFIKYYIVSKEKIKFSFETIFLITRKVLGKDIAGYLITLIKNTNTIIINNKLEKMVLSGENDVKFVDCVFNLIG